MKANRMNHKLIKQIISIFKIKKAAFGAIVILFFILVAILAPLIAPYSPSEMVSLPVQPPSWSHLFGTNTYGQDLFSRVVWGARLSLLVGVECGIITSIFSLIIGLSAGYFGGIIDDILTTITNIFLIIPGLPLIIVIAAYIAVKGVTPIVFVISITGWAWGARVFRSQMMTLRNRDFVKAAVVLGEHPIRIIFFEIFPNMLSLVAANFFGTMLYAVLTEASLEFIGLGNVNVVTWGTILYWAQNNQALMLGAWWWFIIPGLCIALLGVSLAMVNFAIDEITNPRLKRA